MVLFRQSGAKDANHKQFSKPHMHEKSEM